MRLVLHREIPEDNILAGQWNQLVQQMEFPEVFYTYEWSLAVSRAYQRFDHAPFDARLRGRFIGGCGRLGN